ncbi:MAG: DUF4337 domain-containing protein [Verrucomicrobia bacterium]|nr:DUF4337 domain-containing protein [Verrucomicrobiota bacterium]
MEQPEVPVEHLHEEIHHRAEHSREKWILGVALSSALLAGLAAVASLMAGHFVNEAMIQQIKSAGRWEYYQAKSIKEAQLTGKIEILEALGKPVLPGDQGKIDEYEKEKKDIQGNASELEKESTHLLHRHEVLSRSVTFFQIAIAVGAIAVLIKRRSFWIASIVCGVIGLGSFIHALLV